jgi:NitT/TauT family transport system substrate-binding protein
MNTQNTFVNSNQQRSIRVIVFITIIVAIVIGTFFYLNQTGKQSPVSKTVTIAQFGDLLLYLPLYIAADEGLFAKHGLNVHIASTGGDDKTYAAVMSGSADFGLADPTFVAIAQEQGQSGKVVALIINGMPNYGVALTPDKPVIKTPAELKGRTVATVPAPSTSYALMKKLYERAGLLPAIRQVAPPALVPTLQAGEADYALLIEPWVSGVVQSGGHVAFSLTDYYPEFALTGLTSNMKTIQQDPATVENVVLALTEAVQIFYGDEERSLRVAVKHFPDEKPEQLKTGISRMRSDKIYPRVLSVSEKAWDAALQLRRDTGDLTKPAQPIGEYVDNSFAQKAASDGGQH